MANSVISAVRVQPLPPPRLRRAQSQPSLGAFLDLQHVYYYYYIIPVSSDAQHHGYETYHYTEQYVISVEEEETLILNGGGGDYITASNDEEIARRPGLEIRKPKRPEDDDKVCAVCLDCLICRDDDEGKKWAIGVVDNCGHEFHVGCIQKWLTKKNNCPLCRAIVS